MTKPGTFEFYTGLSLQSRERGSRLDGQDLMGCRKADRRIQAPG